MKKTFLASSLKGIFDNDLCSTVSFRFLLEQFERSSSFVECPFHRSDHVEGGDQDGGADDDFDYDVNLTQAFDLIILSIFMVLMIMKETMMSILPKHQTVVGGEVMQHFVRLCLNIGVGQNFFWKISILIPYTK